MPLSSYLEFVPGREVCIRASDSSYIFPVLHHGSIVGEVKLDKLNVSLRGEVKHMLKHILYFSFGSTEFLYNDSARFTKDSTITTSLDWEMKHRQVIIYFKDYAPTVAFFFMKDAEIKPAQVMQSLSTLCESSFIGFHGFPVYNSQVKAVVRRERKELWMFVLWMRSLGS